MHDKDPALHQLFLFLQTHLPSVSYFSILLSVAYDLPRYNTDLKSPIFDKKISCLVKAALQQLDLPFSIFFINN